MPETSSPVPKTGHPSFGKTLAVTFLGLGIFVALALYGDVGSVSRELQTFDYRFLWLALGLSFGNFLIRAARFQYFLRRVGVKVPWLESILVFFAGMVMTVTPGKAGEVFKSFLLKWTRDAPLAKTTAIVVAERVSDLIALLLLSAWGVTLFPRGNLVALCLLLAAFSLVALLAWRSLAMITLGWLSKIPLLKRKRDRLVESYDSLHSVLRPTPLLNGLLLSVLAWGLQVVALSVLVFGTSETWITLRESAFAYCSPLLAGVLAFMPGGLGVTEVGMASALAQTGDWATREAVVSVTILGRLATLWWAVILGAVALLIHKKITGWEPISASITRAPSDETTSEVSAEPKRN